jgi:hypothetical protein
MLTLRVASKTLSGRLHCFVNLLAVKADHKLFADYQRRSCSNPKPPQLVDGARRLANVDFLEFPSSARQILCRMMAGCSTRLCVYFDHGSSIAIIGDRLLFSLFSMVYLPSIRLTSEEKGKRVACHQLSPEGSAFAACFLQQSYRLDGRTLFDGFHHIIKGKSRHRDCGKRFHLDTRSAGARYG